MSSIHHPPNQYGGYIIDSNGHIHVCESEHLIFNKYLSNIIQLDFIHSKWAAA